MRNALPIIALGHDLGADDFTGVDLLCIALTLPLGVSAALLRKPTPPALPDRTSEPDVVEPPGPA